MALSVVSIFLAIFVVAAVNIEANYIPDMAQRSDLNEANPSDITDEAGATSFWGSWWDNYYSHSPESAFKENARIGWCSSGSKMPQSIWKHFIQPLNVYRISFQRRRNGYDLDVPTKVDVFGSNDDDCANEASWVTLATDDSVKLMSREDTWIIDIPNSRIGSYRCYGIRVKDASIRSNGEKYACVSHIKFYSHDAPIVVTTTPSPPAKTVQCGVETTTTTRIVGGVEVTPIRKYSWQVSIGHRNSHFCGGSIITDKHILTAAHCFYDRPRNKPCYRNVPSQIFVRIGDHNIWTSSDNLPDFVHPIEVKARQVIIHESYDCATIENDIAVVELSKSLELLNHLDVLHPVCLPLDDSETYVGVTATASGWGSTVGFDPRQKPIPRPKYPNILREVQLPVVPNSECANLNGGDFTKQICAGVIEGGKGPCNGDSGGPLTVNENGHYTQIGIISYGGGCANKGYLGVYTRVSYYLDWIKWKVRSEMTYTLP